VLVLQCLVALPLFPVILAGSYDKFGRTMPAELTPNYCGMMALVAFIGACSVRNWIWMIILSLLPLYVMDVMESRDAMLAAVVAGLVMLWCRARSMEWKKLRPLVLSALIGGPIVVIGLYFAGIDLIGAAGTRIDNILLLDDQYRGVGSGASGRAELWKAALNLWLTHPIFGVGFKGHQNFMPDQMLAHNAYLGMLADVGAVGFAAYLIILWRGSYHLFKRGASALSAYPERLAIFLSYLAYGMLESRAFSFGNTYSVLFLLVVFDSSRYPVQPAQDADSPGRETTPAKRDASAEASVLSRFKI
jgi:O-antigen ligase